ncbi:MAG: hydroxymethylglutaryl-CoA synthase [Candidatus Jordarchaeaceae archaeon]
MLGISGYGVYIPLYRIKLKDIATAWKEDAQPSGEKSVAYFDENVVTLAYNACRNAIKHADIKPSDIDALYLGTVSSPYIEASLAAPLANSLGLPENANVVDFGASTIAGAAALQAGLDAVKSGRLENVLIVGSDILVGAPGTSFEYTAGAGAAACILSSNSVVAEYEGSFFYTTGFADKWRSVESKYPVFGDTGFIRKYGYIEHVVKAAKGLFEKIGTTAQSFNHIVLQQQESRMISEASKSLGFTPEQLKAGMTLENFGDTGSASILIGLSAILDQAEPGQKILAVSYGSGSSAAFSFKVNEKIKYKREKSTPVKTFKENKEYIDYFTHLRQNRIIPRTE